MGKVRLATLDHSTAPTAQNAIQSLCAQRTGQISSTLNPRAPDTTVVDLPPPDPQQQKPKKPRNAFTGMELAAQVHQVQEWLSVGYRPNEIRRLSAEEWGLSSRTAESRMAEARRQMIADANVMDRQEKVGQMLQQLETVLKQALEMRQGSNAIGALRLQADLLQLLSRQN